jgi:zinc transport system permease protein
VYLGLLALIALTVVILIRIVGIILVIALLTIPAAISRKWVGSLRQMMWTAPMLAAVFTCSGLIASYYLDIASGATIIVIAGIAYFINIAVSKPKSS